MRKGRRKVAAGAGLPTRRRVRQMAYPSIVAGFRPVARARSGDSSASDPAGGVRGTLSEFRLRAGVAPRRRRRLLAGGGGEGPPGCLRVVAFEPGETDQRLDVVASQVVGGVGSPGDFPVWLNPG